MEMAMEMMDDGGEKAEKGDQGHGPSDVGGNPILKLYCASCVLRLAALSRLLACLVFPSLTLKA